MRYSQLPMLLPILHLKDIHRRLLRGSSQASLARLLARRFNGISSSDFERGEIEPDLFRHACMLGLEGLVSKRNDRPYRAGVSPNWVRVKKPEPPAMARVKDAMRPILRGKHLDERHAPSTQQ